MDIVARRDKVKTPNIPELVKELACIPTITLLGCYIALNDFVLSAAAMSNILNFCVFYFTAFVSISNASDEASVNCFCIVSFLRYLVCVISFVLVLCGYDQTFVRIALICTACIVVSHLLLLFNYLLGGVRIDDILNIVLTSLVFWCVLLYVGICNERVFLQTFYIFIWIYYCFPINISNRLLGDKDWDSCFVYFLFVIGLFSCFFSQR